MVLIASSHFAMRLKCVLRVLFIIRYARTKPVIITGASDQSVSASSVVC